MFDFKSPSFARYLRRTLIRAAIVVAIVAALCAFVAGSDDRLKSFLESKGADRAGRSFTIGQLHVDWNWHEPVFHLTDVRLSNAPNLPDPDMVNIKAIDFSVAIWQLLRGRLEIPDLTLTAPTLIFEKTDADTKNWDLPSLSKGNVAADAVVPEDRGDFPVIHHLKITDGVVTYRDHVKDLSLDLHLSGMEGNNGEDKDTGFTLNGDGTLSGKDFKIESSGGSLFTLNESSKPFPLKATIKMGDTEVTIDGAFKDPIKMEGVDTALHLKGSNLADLYDLTSIPLPLTPAYDFTGRLKKDGDVWSFTVDKGRVGSSDLNGTGSYDTGRTRGLFKADFHSALLHLEDLGGFIGYAPATKAKLPSDKLFPAIPLNVAHLRASDMDVRLDADKLEAPGLPFQSMHARFDLQNGLLRIDPLQFDIAGGTGKGTIQVDAREDTPKMDMDILLRGMNMHEFFEGSRFESLSGGRFGGRIQIAGTGASLADVLGTANGRLSLLMGGGKISLLIIEAAGLDIAEAAPLLLEKDKTTNVRCGVADFTVRNGYLYSDQFVFDTNDTKLEGEAQVDLKQEVMKARMAAHPKDKSILVARTPLTISGPLRKPRIGIDPTDLGARGAAAAVLGAVLTPLASFIPFIELGLGEDADCRAMIKDVKGRYDGNIPSPAASTVPAMRPKE